ncbi:MAG: MFS transporter [Pseudonocardia sp.]
MSSAVPTAVPTLVLADYRAVLTAPGALVPVLTSALGRLPTAMIGLALLLYVADSTGSFAAAGLVNAGGLIGMATGSVVQGRIIDRLGPTRPLLLAAVLFGAAAAALVLAVEGGRSVPLLMALALLLGALQPALPGASRALWTVLVPAGPRREAALTYEAISLEVFFVLGPALAALLFALGWAGSGLVTACTAMVAGTVGFALSRPVRRGRGGGGGSLGLLGALGRPGMRTVALAALGFGLAVGAVEVGVPAVTTAGGSAALGGLLLAGWACTSVLAGLLYGLRPWPVPLHQRLPALMGACGVLVAVMAATTGVLALFVVALLAAGTTITAQVTAHSLAVEAAAPPGTATEAFGWVITAAGVGLAAGQSGAGIAVEAAGPSSAFVVGGAAGVAVAALLWLRRRTLAPVAATVPPSG